MGSPVAVQKGYGIYEKILGETMFGRHPVTYEIKPNLSLVICKFMQINSILKNSC